MFNEYKSSMKLCSLSWSLKINPDIVSLPSAMQQDFSDKQFVCLNRALKQGMIQHNGKIQSEQLSLFAHLRTCSKNLVIILYDFFMGFFSQKIILFRNEYIFF